MNPLTPSLRRIHHHGTLKVLCSSGLQAELEMEAGKTAVAGRIFQTERREEELGGLEGDWASHLRLSRPGLPAETLFRSVPVPPDAGEYFGLSLFARQLNEVGRWERGRLPATDSRFRPDQRAFEEGRLAEAQRLKAQLEAEQRKRRHQSPPQRPLFFQPEPEADHTFRPNNSFWAHYAGRFAGLALPPIFRLSD